MVLGKICGTYSHLMTFYSLIFNAVVFILGCILELPELFQKILMPGSPSRYSNLIQGQPVIMPVVCQHTAPSPLLPVALHGSPEVPVTVFSSLVPQLHKF